MHGCIQVTPVRGCEAVALAACPVWLPSPSGIPRWLHGQHSCACARGCLHARRSCCFGWIRSTTARCWGTANTCQEFPALLQPLKGLGSPTIIPWAKPALRDGCALSGGVLQLSGPSCAPRGPGRLSRSWGDLSGSQEGQRSLCSGSGLREMTICTLRSLSFPKEHLTLSVPPSLSSEKNSHFPNWKFSLNINVTESPARPLLLWFHSPELWGRLCNRNTGVTHLLALQ